MKKILFLTLGLFSVLSLSAQVVNRAQHTFYTYEEMQEDLQQLDSVYADKVHLLTLGQTIDHREVYELIIGDTLAPNAIFVEVGIHGREWMNTWVLMAVLEEYLKKWDMPYASGRTYGDILNHCCIHLIPMMNPDGVTLSQRGLAGIQDDSVRARVKAMPGVENPRRWKSNANGVNLNLNFPYKWSADDTQPNSDKYHGDSAASERETQYTIAALNARKFNACISYHSMGNVVYWDLHQKGELRTKTYDLALFASRLTGYRLGEQSEPRGLDYNYMNLQLQIPTVLLETGGVACPLPYSEFEKVYSRNKSVLIAFANRYYGE